MSIEANIESKNDKKAVDVMLARKKELDHAANHALLQKNCIFLTRKCTDIVIFCRRTPAVTENQCQKYAHRRIFTEEPKKTGIRFNYC